MIIKKYITFVSLAALFTACDMDQFPEGDLILEDQKNEVVADSPEKIIADINALKSNMTQAKVFDNGHADFGVPSISLTADCSGQDMVSEIHGYNWFQPSLRFKDRLSTSSINAFIWKTHYTHIKSANDLLKTLYAGYPEDKRVDEIANYIGQALTNRAYDYLELIQYYQFTYIGHEDALGLPVILENATTEQATNNPRVSVKEIYALIMKDLNQAISYMEKYPIKRTDNAQVTAAVAYGLRARANMLMGKYADAVSDAEQALKLSGARPYTINEVSVPSFNQVADSWIWGIVITPEDGVVKTGIINWPSHLCSLTGNGYTTGTGANVAYKRINSTLYAKMNPSDIRRGWWVDENLQSPALNKAYGDEGPKIGKSMNYLPYTNVKFGPENNELFNAINAQDWPLMRAEEMHLIKAEGLARSKSVAEGKAVLEGFLKECRDPQYSCKANSLEEFIDEVWTQRRIELWGEGFSLQDVLRLKKPIIRKGANFSPNTTYEDIKPESAIMIFNIPECETSVNKGIPLDQINEVATPPTPIN